MVDLEEALINVDAYIDGRYKSIYLMDSWIKIREFVVKKMKEGKDVES